MNNAKITPHSGIGLIAAERKDQLFKHGFNLQHDQQYFDRQVFQNAAIAIIHGNFKEWPHNSIPDKWFYKIMQKSKREQTAIAASLLAAEIDYLYLRDTMGKLPAGESLSRHIDAINHEIFVLGEVAAMPGDEYMRILQPANVEGTLEFNLCTLHDVYVAAVNSVMLDDNVAYDCYLHNKVMAAMDKVVPVTDNTVRTFEFTVEALGCALESKIVHSGTYDGWLHYDSLIEVLNNFKAKPAPVQPTKAEKHLQAQYDKPTYREPLGVPFDEPLPHPHQSTEGC